MAKKKRKKSKQKQSQTNIIFGVILLAAIVFFLFSNTNIIPSQSVCSGPDGTCGPTYDNIWAGQEFDPKIIGNAVVTENGYIVESNSMIEAEGFPIDPNEDYRIEMEFVIQGELISGEFSEVSISFEDESGSEGKGIAQIGSRFDKVSQSTIGTYQATSLVLEKKGNIYTYEDSTGKSFTLPTDQFDSLNKDQLWHFCMYGEVDGEGFVELDLKSISIVRLTETSPGVYG